MIRLASWSFQCGQRSVSYVVNELEILSLPSLAATRQSRLEQQ